MNQLEEKLEQLERNYNHLLTYVKKLELVIGAIIEVDIRTNKAVEHLYREFEKVKGTTSTKQDNDVMIA